PPWGGRLLPISTQFLAASFLSTPSVGRATRPPVRAGLRQHISIHALRGEGDIRLFLGGDLDAPISIHALRGEGDQFNLVRALLNRNFYPRPPWGGRRTKCAKSGWLAHFYPRPPWG